MLFRSCLLSRDLTLRPSSSCVRLVVVTSSRRRHLAFDWVNRQRKWKVEADGLEFRCLATRDVVGVFERVSQAIASLVCSAPTNLGPLPHPS